MPFVWPVDRHDFPPLPDLTDPPTPAYIQAVMERNDAENLAVAILYRLTGRQFGLHSHTVRPCVSRPSLRSGGVTSYLVSWEGDHWINVACGCQGTCTRSGPRMVHLPGPVVSVSEVKVGDVALPADGYVLEGNVLYRVGGPWPRQDLSRPLGEANTWSVTYERGIPVPPEFRQLTGILAKEILVALDDADDECRLPRTVTVASRQGISYRAYDPAVIYANGKTGIAEIDLVIASINPHAVMAPPSVI